MKRLIFDNIMEGSQIKKVLKKKVNGFTLTEMLTVMLIIGILLSMAIPSNQSVITKAKSTQAKISLQSLKTSQKLYFYEFSKYSSNIAELDFEPPKTINEGGTAEYKIEITSASGNSFTARATALKDFDGDGTFDVWEINQDGKPINVTKD